MASAPEPMAASLLDTAAAASIETVVNQILALDPAARAAVAELAGRRARLTLEWPRLSLTLAPDTDRLGISAEDDTPVDASIRTTAAGLLEATAGRAQDSVMTGSVVIDGDEALARRLFAIAQGLRPDLEGPVARVFGATAAHASGEAARRTVRGFRGAASQATAQGRRWLTDAHGPLPARHEIARFLDDVDDVRFAADRLEARVARLRTGIDDDGGRSSA